MSGALRILLVMDPFNRGREVTWVEAIETSGDEVSVRAGGRTRPLPDLR